MTGRRRLNDHKFCICNHGQGAHRNGRGPCVGEKRIQGSWVSCACMSFVYQPAEPDEDEAGDTKASAE